MRKEPAWGEDEVNPEPVSGPPSPLPGGGRGEGLGLQFLPVLDATNVLLACGV